MIYKERVLVKHAVTGKMLLDSSVQSEVTYQIDREEGIIYIKIYAVPKSVSDEILMLQDELNVFWFVEPEAGKGETIKHWFYVKPDGGVTYDAASGTLHIVADNEIEYHPADYWA